MLFVMGFLKKRSSVMCLLAAMEINLFNNSPAKTVKNVFWSNTQNRLISSPFQSSYIVDDLKEMIIFAKTRLSPMGQNRNGSFRISGTGCSTIFWKRYNGTYTGRGSCGCSLVCNSQLFSWKSFWLFNYTKNRFHINNIDHNHSYAILVLKVGRCFYE